MKNWKWRIVISVVSVLLSVGMSPWFYNGLLAHSSNLYFVVNVLDLVPRTFGDITAKYQIDHQLLYWTRGYWLRYLFWEYQLMVFLFWWWVGWKLDLKAASRDCGRAWMTAEAVLGLGLSIMVFEQRVVERIYPYPDAGQWAMILWSMILFGYFLVRLSQLWAMTRQQARHNPLC